MHARILFAQFRGALLQYVAVASLFVLGATTVLKAQAVPTPKGYQGSLNDPASRPIVVPIYGPADPRSPRDTALASMIGTMTGAPRPARTPNRKARQVASDWSRSTDYSGPRFGFTYLPDAVVDSLKSRNIDVGSTITQFGWQLEREIHVSAEGPMVLNEWIFLVGGLEKGVFLPSVSWLVGARGKSGNEIGFGPNVSIAGVGLAAAAGVTVHNGGLHFPMNVAVASSKGGLRVSFLTGFTLH